MTNIATVVYTTLIVFGIIGLTEVVLAWYDIHGRDKTDDEDMCYNHMEKTGYAAFGCCTGMEEECCKICRYHVNVKENNKNG